MVDTNISIITNTKQKIIELLFHSGWTDKLRLFIKSSDMDELLEKLLNHSQEGRHFTPTLKDVFTAFVKCPFDDVKAVIIGQDPYPYINIADGIAFSCSKTGKLQPSLRYIFKEIEKINGVHYEEQNPDLTRWAEQGVLCLNSALTCQIDKIGSHYDIWKDFMFMVLDALNLHHPHVPYILMGKTAHSFSPYISGPKVKVSHPASAAYAKAKEWDSEECFIKVNDILKTQQKQIINW